MSEGKEIKFKFVVDEQSAQRVNKVLDDMIKRAQDLAKTLQGVGGGGGGLLGGGAVGGRSPSSQTTMTRAAGSAQQKVSFASVLGQNVDTFKKMAQEGGAAMKVLGDAVQRGISTQQREIGRLQQSLDALVATYNRVGGAASGALGEKLQTKVLQVSSRISEHRKMLSQLESVAPKRPELMPEVPWPGAEGGAGEAAPAPLSRWARFKGMMTAQRQIPGLAGAMQGTGLGQIAGRMGITPGMVGSAGLAAVGAWGVKNIANQVWNAPNQFLESQAAWGQAYGKRSMDIRAGDFRNIMAEQNILRDSSKRQDYQDLNSGWRRFVHGGKAFFSGDFNAAFSGRASDLGVRRAREAQIQMERESNPLEDAIKGEAQNYRGTMSAMRAMGIGVRRKGDSGFQRLSEYRKGYSSFDDSEIAAAFQGLSASGTRRGAYALQGGVMQATAAGIHGAAQSVGTMSKFGPGAGAAFSHRLREMAGGGMDATTAGLLGSYMAQQQDRFGLSTSGATGFQGAGLMEMLGTGGAAPGGAGRLNVEQNIRGMDYLQRSMTGQTNPYQAARNFMVAREAAPGLNMYGQSFLARKMSMTELADAATGKGGDVSEVFQALGGNKKMAANYFKGQTKTLLEGVASQGLGDENAGRLMKALADSGQDPREFFQKGGWKNLKSKSTGKAMTEKEAVAAYAGALQSSDADMDPAQAMGLARTISGKGAKATKGKLAGDVAGGSQEAEVAKEHTNAVALQNNTGALNELTQAIKNLALRTKFEQEGMGFKGLNEEQRERRERAISELGPNASKTDLMAVEAELEIADKLKNNDMTRSEAMIKLGVSGYRQLAKKRGIK